MSFSLRPRVVIAAVPTRIPLVTNGDLSSKGTMFLFTVMSAFPRAASASLPVMFLLRKSISIMWLSVPPLIISYPFSIKAAAMTAALFFT